MHMPLARCTRARRARRASVRAKKQALDLISRFRSSVNPTTSCQFSARNQTSQCCSSTRQARAHSALLRAMLSSSTRLLRITNLRSHLTAAHSGGRVCYATRLRLFRGNLAYTYPLRVSELTHFPGYCRAWRRSGYGLVKLLVYQASSSL